MSAPAAEYYEGPELTDLVLGALRAGGRDVERLDLDDLAALDEFHALGRPATLALAELTQVAEGDRVLDVGAGIGGPGRVLASRCRAQVTALDATGRFCRLNSQLSQRTGLAERVTVVEGLATDLPFPDGTFDVVWTQAVWQNIPDKTRLVRELVRVLRAGGRLAAFEIVEGSGEPIHLPVPWADRADQSFLVPPTEMRELLEVEGLVLEVWHEGAEVQASIQRAMQDVPMPQGDTPVGLDLILPDFKERMAGLARNVEEGRIGLVQAAATKPA